MLNRLCCITLFCLMIAMYCTKKSSIPIKKVNLDGLPERILYPMLIIGDDETPEETLYRPNSVILNKKNEIIVLDSGNNRVMVYDNNGNFLREFGRIGQGPGEFMDPSDINIDREGNIYVLDTGNGRIQKFDPEGNYVSNAKILPPLTPLYDHFEFDSKGRICLNRFSESRIFNIYSNIWKNPGRIERVIPALDINHRSYRPRVLNDVYFGLDREDNFYLLYQVIPRLRKFDKNGILIFDIELTSASIDKAKNDFEKAISKKLKNGKIGGVSKYYYFNSFLVSPKGGGYIWRHKYYHFNSKGEFLETIVLKETPGDEYPFPPMDAFLDNDDYLYAVNSVKCKLLKFNLKGGEKK